MTALTEETLEMIEVPDKVFEERQEEIADLFQDVLVVWS
jgi:NTP pyrophosphatase (non-canonical NTP hydrolase)